MLTSLVCVDASVVVALVTTEHLSHAALALWREWTTQEQQPVAPMLLRYEVTSALHRKAVDGKMSREDAAQALQKALACDIRYLDPSAINELAFTLAARFKRPATYDSHYLALAEQLQCPVWTADERLFNAVHAEFPHIRWLGHYQAGN
jgi:predicted nucleic acid-binding protein